MAKIRWTGDGGAGGLIIALLRWFAKAKRAMPWRETRDPYAIWVSETMLQQTQMETVKPFYHKFLGRFPTVGDLAGAELESVLQMWAGLGYYRRAKHLHAAAQAVVARHGGKVPRTAAQLIDLPGVGRYTAGAVASIAFGERAAIVDGNVARVLARVGAVKGDIKKPQTLKRIWGMAEALVVAVPTGSAGDFNQSLMELGALICIKRTPKCTVCPISAYCCARKLGLAERLPEVFAKQKTPVRELVAVKIRDSRGRMLVMKRPRGGLWEEMWEVPVLAVPVSGFEFPEKEEAGGTVREKRERSPKQVTDFMTGVSLNWGRRLTDKIDEALGLRVVVEQRWDRVRHVLTHRRLEYWVASGRCASAGPEARLPACERGFYTAYRWVTRRAMSALPMATGMRKVMAAGDGRMVKCLSG